MKNNKLLIIALLVPIVALLALNFFKAYKVKTGNELTLPITGYDPRDLLAGQYLIFRIDYGSVQSCHAGGLTNYQLKTFYLCYPSKTFSLTPPEKGACEIFLRGSCSASGRFTTGIERFYLPENQVREVEKAVMEGRGSIQLSVDPNGRPSVKSLLIDHKDWRESLIKK